MKIIEFFGTPRAGKTTIITRLSNHLNQLEIKHKIITDREIEKEINIPFEKAFEYNILYFNKVFEKIHNNNEDYDLIILDRGFTDASVWFEVEHKQNNLSSEDKKTALDYFGALKDKYIDIAIFMIVEPKTTFVRHKQKGEQGIADDYVMNEDHITNLHNEYLILNEKYKGDNRVLILDGKRPIEVLEFIVKSKVNELLGNFN